MHKVKNIRKKGTVYFNVDEDPFSYRCVKGKAKARISEDINWNVPMAEKVMVKYVGSTDHPVLQYGYTGDGKERRFDNLGINASLLFHLGL